MIYEFKTARNINGHRKYLKIDTEEKRYTTVCREMIMDGIEIKAKDRKELIEKLEKAGYREYIEL